MNEIRQAEFAAYLPQAGAAAGDCVYPCAIAAGIQSGRIFTDGLTVLFWHHCGFAYLSGKPGSAFLQALLPFFRIPARRFVLITDDRSVQAFFAEQAGFEQSDRIYYRAEQPAPVPMLPEGFSLRKTDAALLHELTGRIIPAFSWESPEQFFANGFGYCVMHGKEIAASAFSAAVTSDAVDIGVETADGFRRRGLATIAAAAVMQETASQGKTAVWAHHAQNTGSMKTAQALGFQPERICKTIIRTPD